MGRHGKLVRIFEVPEWRKSGAHFWDALRNELPAWNALDYEWIGTSAFGDQIIRTLNSPIHRESAIYVHGPDVAGPVSDDPNWLDNILYLGPSFDVWHARIKRFGDEYSIVPGSIGEFVDDPEAYRKIYRELNPGLPW